MSSAGENTPDLSKIVSVIMEHPELIEQISRLVSPEKTESQASLPSEEAAADTVSEEKIEPTVSIPAQNSVSKRRSQLLYALKPYLSERRSRAIDSMLTFGEIFDMMRSK